VSITAFRDRIDQGSELGVALSHSASTADQLPFVVHLGVPSFSYGEVVENESRFVLKTF
jgi:hypothetical protein